MTNGPSQPGSTNPSEPHGGGGASPEELVTEYLPFVTALAKKIKRTLPDFVEVGDLEGFGQIGLIEASRRFDATRGVQFKTFAYYRIRGAIYDGIRKMAWFDKDPDQEVTYQAASNQILGEASESTDKKAGPSSLDDEIEQTRQTIRRLAGARLLSLDHESMGEIAGDAESPDAAVELAQIAGMVQECVQELDEKERSVIQAYYFGHKTLEEAGAAMGLSKSWTSRVHARALQNLGSLVRKRGLDASA